MPDRSTGVGLSSTTWEWKLCKIRSAHLQGIARSSADSSRGTRRRKPVRQGVVQLVVVYRGGAEDSWLVRVDRGPWLRIPGWMCLTDALTRFESAW